jgi:hypothetical protein
MSSPRSLSTAVRQVRQEIAEVDPVGPVACWSTPLPGGEAAGWLADELLGVGAIGGVQRCASAKGDLRHPAVVDVCGGEQPDPGAAVLVVVPAEEPLAEHSSV